MDKAILYSRQVGRVMSHEPGRILPKQRSIWPRFSLGVRTANFIFTAGQPSVDNEGNVLAVGDIRQQTINALDNVRMIIESGGGDFRDVAKIRLFVGTRDDYQRAVAALAEYLSHYVSPEDAPAFSLALAPTSSGLTLVEPEPIAATEHQSVRSDRLFRGFAPGCPEEMFASAVRVGNLVFTSGQLGIDAEGRVAGTSAQRQAEQALENVEAAIEAAGLQASDIVKLTTFVDNPRDVAAVREARLRFLHDRFPDKPVPAATTIVVPLAPEGMRVEIEAVAATGDKEPIQTDGVYCALSGGEPFTQAVKVPLECEAGSFLRRLTWPTFPQDADRAQLGGHLEVMHPLGHLLFLSALAPLDRGGRLVGLGDMKAQTQQVFENARIVTEAAGGRFSDIVQADYYFARRDLYEEFNEIRVRFCEQQYPDKDWFCGSAPIAHSTVDGVLLEFEGIAAIP